MILAARELAASHVTGYLNTITQQLHEGDLAQLDLTVTSSIVVHTGLTDTLIRVAEDGEFVQDNAGLEDWMRS